jgi:hypothetical protein
MIFDNFKKLAPGIYLYENFLSFEENSKIFESIKNINESNWKKVGQGENSIFTLNTEIVNDLRIKVSSICPNGMDPVYNNVVNRIGIGVTYGDHRDTNKSQDALRLSEEYKEGDEFLIHDYPKFGLVYYFNDDYEDGAIYYPELGIRHKPKPGDLVIHEADILHGTEQPKNGIRYTYTSAFTKKIKIKK